MQKPPLATYIIAFYGSTVEPLLYYHPQNNIDVVV